MTTQPEEERRGGLRGAVEELFGRGDKDAGDERGENVHRDDDVHRDDGVHRDDAYAQDSTLDREPGATTELGDTQTQSQSHYAGDPMTDDTQHQTTYGDEARGDTDLPGQSRYDDAERGVHSDFSGSDVPSSDVPSGVSGSVRHDDPAVSTPAVDDAAVTAPTTTSDQAPTTTSDQVGTGSVDDTRDRESDRTDAGQPVGEPVGTETHLQAAATPEAPSTPAASATTAATATHDTGTGHDTGAGHDTVAGHDTTATHDTGTANMAAADQSDAEGHAALVTAERAESYSSRWNDVKGEFVDEPRRAVADADALVGELLDELQDLFKAQRSEIEHSLDADETSTEDLRLALRRYRSFFDRLLSI